MARLPDDVAERADLVRDAILLERAVAVIERRLGDHLPSLAIADKLRWMATSLRREAGQVAPPVVPGEVVPEHKHDDELDCRACYNSEPPQFAPEGECRHGIAVTDQDAARCAFYEDPENRKPAGPPVRRHRGRQEP
jgi:hypothetical protein